MKNLIFDKKCNAEVLTNELKVAGFNIYGCSTEDDDKIGLHKVTVHLKDTETKNPQTIVNSHIYTPIVIKTDKDRLIELLKDVDVKNAVKAIA